MTAHIDKVYDEIIKYYRQVDEDCFGGDILFYSGRPCPTGGQDEKGWLWAAWICYGHRMDSRFVHHSVLVYNKP